MSKLQRNNSLDALRGLAILLMVLSSSIAFGVLPGWMYHAQVPPPAHVFNPDLPGITWVDLVFPFFLFSMGAAIPLAMHKKLAEWSSIQILWSIVKRFLFLVFFAFFTFHTRAWVLSKEPDAVTYLLSIIAFLLLFPMYGNIGIPSRYASWVQILVFALGIGLVAFGYAEGNSFSLQSVDIIILVLANMALFGTLIWWLTRNCLWLRIGFLPFIMAVFLASKIPGSVNEAIFNWTPVSWIYKFYYLKYLFMIIPAALAGEWILEDVTSSGRSHKGAYTGIMISGMTLLLVNLICLYNRWLEINLLLSVLLVVIMSYWSFCIRKDDQKNLVSRLVLAGSYLLTLGLFFEAFEGGIKKDFSTFSYYFVSTGLAFVSLAIFTIVERLGWAKRAINFLSQNGKNPMIAYTAGNLLLIPLLKLTDTEKWLNLLNSNFAEGLLRGLIFTGIVALITVFFTRRKIFWKT